MNVSKTPRTSSSAPRLFRATRQLAEQTSSHLGLVVFVCSLAAMSLLVGVRHTPGVKVFAEGEIATQDVMASQDMLVEDRNSTLEKIHRIAEAQPSIFDLTSEAATRLAARIEAIFLVLNNATMESMEDARWQAAELINRELSRTSFHLLRDPELQAFIQGPVLDWISVRLAEGVVLDSRMLEKFPSGVLVREASRGAEVLRADLSQIRDVNSLARELEQHLRRDLNKSLRVRSAVMELVEPLITPSLALNPEATRDRIDDVMQSLEPVYYHIRKGEMVVRQGQRVGAQEQLKLQSLYSQEPETFDAFRPLGVFLICMLFAGGMIVSPKGRFFRAVNNRDALLMAGLVLLFAGGTKLLAAIETPLSERLDFLDGDLLTLVAPLAGAGGVMALYFSAASCVSASILLAFLCAQMAGGGLELFCFYFLASIAATLLIKHTETRTEVLRSVVPLIGLLLLAWTGVHLLKYQAGSGIWVAVGFVVVHGLLGLLCVLALGPIAEMLLGYTSRFRLLEQMSLEQPLLQELMVTSPGTYHHSLIVGNMVEAAARATGANPLLSKVAALYHDVGKIKNPQYFIENQMGCRNKHDKLAPSMSALILVSHVKKGVELARKHKISPEIIDILQQHHGTSLIRFFFAKAQEQAEAKGGDPVSEADYRYPGPKPQTKEAGLVLLADAIEASSRTLVDPTPGRIKAHVDQIIRTIFTDGQLDESELTLKDLTQASACFVRILNGIFHTRIEYPEARKEGAKPCLPAASQPASHPASQPGPPVQSSVQSSVQTPEQGEAILPAPVNGPLQ